MGENNLFLADSTDSNADQAELNTLILRHLRNLRDNLRISARSLYKFFDQHLFIISKL